MATSYRLIEDQGPDSEPIAASVDQWYDRSSRSWVTQLFDQSGYELDSDYDGTKADAAARKLEYQRRLAAGR